MCQRIFFDFLGYATGSAVSPIKQSTFLFVSKLLCDVFVCISEEVSTLTVLLIFESMGCFKGEYGRSLTVSVSSIRKFGLLSQCSQILSFLRILLFSFFSMLILKAYSVSGVVFKRHLGLEFLTTTCFDCLTAK